MLRSSSFAAIGGALARLSGRPLQTPAGMSAHRIRSWCDAWTAARAFVVFPCSGFEFLDADGCPVASRYLEDDGDAWPQPEAAFLNGALARAAGSPEQAALVIGDSGRRRAWLEGWISGVRDGWDADEDGCPFFSRIPAPERWRIQLAEIHPSWQLAAPVNRLGPIMPTGTELAKAHKVVVKDIDGSDVEWFVAVGPEGTFPTMFPFHYQALALSAALFRRWILARDPEADPEAAWFSDPAGEPAPWRVVPCINPLEQPDVFLVTGPRGWLAHAFEDFGAADRAMGNLRGRVSYQT